MEISFAKMNGDFNRVAKIICAAIQRSGELDLSSMSEKEKYNRLISSITQWIRDEESIMKVFVDCGFNNFYFCFNYRIPTSFWHYYHS